MTAPVARAFVAQADDLLVVTGATGFIGARVVERLLARGFRHIRCFARPSSDAAGIVDAARRHPGARVEIVRGNLLAEDDCAAAARDARVIYHLAAGTGQKSYADAFLNSVVTTRNLLEAAGRHARLARFVSISSFAVYSNAGKRPGRTLDESSPVDERPELRREAYCFAKVRQEQIVADVCERLAIPYVIVRPGAVYGPGKGGITDRVGVQAFGLFLHLGGSNQLPLTYVDNCADAIVLAGLTPGVDGRSLNVVDDDLPTSRRFLRLYKRHVRRFPSVYVPHLVSYLLCYVWERSAAWSQGQVPPSFNRRRWRACWRPTRYSNARLKQELAWAPSISTAEGLRRSFAAARSRHA